MYLLSLDPFVTKQGSNDGISGRKWQVQVQVHAQAPGTGRFVPILLLIVSSPVLLYLAMRNLALHCRQPAGSSAAPTPPFLDFDFGTTSFGSLFLSCPRSFVCLGPRQAARFMPLAGSSNVFSKDAAVRSLLTAPGHGKSCLCGPPLPHLPR